jgi:hypothetical protein
LIPVLARNNSTEAIVFPELQYFQAFRKKLGIISDTPTNKTRITLRQIKLRHPSIEVVKLIRTFDNSLVK